MVCSPILLAVSSPVWWTALFRKESALLMQYVELIIDMLFPGIFVITDAVLIICYLIATISAPGSEVG
jgi:hypothetical protein